MLPQSNPDLGYSLPEQRDGHTIKMPGVPIMPGMPECKTYMSFRTKGEARIKRWHHYLYLFDKSLYLSYYLIFIYAKHVQILLGGGTLQEPLSLKEGSEALVIKPKTWTLSLRYRINTKGCDAKNVSPSARIMYTPLANDDASKTNACACSATKSPS